MALIICPECGNKVSNYAETCTQCGFPIKKYMEDHGLNDLNKLFICPKCAGFWAGNGEDTKDFVRIKCNFCNIPLIQTTESFEDTIPKLVNYFDENSELNYYEHLADEVGGHQLSKEACEYRKQQCRKYNAAKREEPTPSNLPTCPTCGSTNIQKISGLNRAAHGYMFGLFSKTAKSQFCCKNCGYKW